MSRIYKITGFFAKKPYKRDYILQKRPVILRSLLLVATPYEVATVSSLIAVYVYNMYVCICINTFALQYIYMYIGIHKQQSALSQNCKVFCTECLICVGLSSKRDVQSRTTKHRCPSVVRPITTNRPYTAPPCNTLHHTATH